MKDYLQDIVQHTHALGVIELLKITGTATGTTVESIAEDRSVILQAQFKNPVPEFVGVFGMPNLGKLNTIINIPEYKEDAKLSITTQKNSQGADVPAGINFENKSGDFKNNYRFMATEVVNDVLKSVTMKSVKWDVEITPSVASLTKLKFMSQANSEENTFIAKTENNSLKFFFGDHSSHSGNFVFQDGVSGTLSTAWNWPVAVVIGIMNLAGDKTLRISNEGVMQITVDSGIAEYNYKIPAQKK
jgi:hypothetical protein